MCKTIFFVIASILILLCIGCNSREGSVYSTERFDSVIKKDSLKDTLLMQLFHPNEINIKWVFKHLPTNHTKYGDAFSFKKYFYMLQETEKDYRKDTDYLNDLGKSKDTLLFFSKTSEILKKWKAKNIPSLYYEQILFSSSRIDQNQFLSKTTKSKKIHEYFALIKNDVDEIAPELYKYFFIYGGYEVEYLKANTKSGFEKKRKELLINDMYLGAMFQAAIDTSFNFDQQLWMNVDIPQGFVGSDNYFAGMDPDEIKEPVLRQAYKDSIMANSWIGTRYNRQVDLRRGYNEIIQYLNSNISDLYSIPPQNNAELDSILNEYVIDTAFKQSIIRYVNASFEKNNYEYGTISD